MQPGVYTLTHAYFASSGAESLYTWSQSSRVLLKPFGLSASQSGFVFMSTGAATAMVTVDDIRRAYGRIRESLFLSPCAHSETFSQITGNKVFLKMENLQMTGAYKERG